MKASVLLIVGLCTTVAMAGSPEPASNPVPFGPCEGQTRICGTINSVDAQAGQLEVADTPVRITDKTIFRMGPTLIAFEDLVPDQTVVVIGEMEDDVLVAKRINVRYHGRADVTGRKGWGYCRAAGRGWAWSHGMRHGRRAGHGWRCRDGQEPGEGSRRGGDPGWRGAGKGRGKAMGRGRGHRRGPGWHGPGKGRRFRDAPPGSEPQAFCPFDTRLGGKITEIDAGNKMLVIGDAKVQITDTTRITAGPAEIGFDDLVVGQFIRVGGTQNGETTNAIRLNVCGHRR